MATSGGRGTMGPPTDGEDVARVIPLRRRASDGRPVASVRESLPREHAPFDPEIELGEIVLKRRRRRRLMARLSEVARRRAPRWRLRRSRTPLADPRVVAIAAVSVAILSAAAVGAIESGGV